MKLITFQYKVIHNVLPNQVSLLRAGIAINNTCPLCNAEKQASNHMLYSCLLQMSSPANGVPSSEKDLCRVDASDSRVFAT